MINKKLIEQIQKDIDIFDNISSEQQDKLVNGLLKNGIKFTDSIFENLAKEENINEIENNIDFIIPFLFRMANFLLSENEDKNNERLNIESLNESLIFKNNYTKENIKKIFSLESNFLKSVECENISEKIIDNIENYKSYNLISEIKYGEFLISSKINIINKNKNIELILDLEQLNNLKTKIEENINNLEEFKNTIENKKITIFK